MVWIDYASSFDKICEGGKHKTHLCIPLRQGTARDWRGVPKFMDEPTTGLDPQTRIMVWDFIANCRRQNGLTVFLTTHYMEEAGSADYVVILDNGKIAAEGTPLELKNTYTGDFIKLYGIDSKQLDDAGLSYTLENGHAKLFVKNTGQVKQLISQHPDLFEDFEVIKGNMDDVFLQVTGKELKQV